MTKEYAILAASIFLSEQGEEIEDFCSPNAEWFPTVQLGANIENRATWRVAFWMDLSFFDAGLEVFHYPIEIWVDDKTEEAWWIDDSGQPTETSWRHKQVRKHQKQK